MTPERSQLPYAGRLYVVLVAGTGIGVVLHSLQALVTQSIGYQWFVLAGLTLLSGSFTIRIPTIPARLSVSETFVFATAMLFGPAAATIIVVLDSLIASLWLRRASRSHLRLMFNMSAPAISIWLSSHAFFAIARVEPLSVTPQPILSLIFPLLLMALFYFLMNSWLIALAVGFEKGPSPFEIWRTHFLWLSLNYFSGASVAALLLPYLQDEQHAFIRIAVTLLPLLLISYLTFKTALGRVEDANRHLSELNRLYLSTIETLAMAIDAKDQITHGHIRRVQQFAKGLARRLGITDASQLSAIEAASLLHDMGKLAVPEYILNKPGRLTPAEFERMKQHASVGADILSAIDFPYPVVPIVRHHHENWDGTGYPDGLQGGDIPIGARILSVVDCFDALTSDRPYRPRLSDSEAIKILLERRGSMYDPLVVDTFLEVYPEIAPRDSAELSRKATVSLAASDSASVAPGGPAETGLDDIAASTEETRAILELARSLKEARSLADISDAAAQSLRRAVPASLCVLYSYDAVSDELVAAFASGEHAGHFTHLRIPRGERLTGWVAANRQTILNSDPVLDLGEAARALRPRLRASLSTPLLHEHILIGVLSVYAVDRDAFSENHRRVAETIAREISSTFARYSGAVLEADAVNAESATEAESRNEPSFSIVYLQVAPRHEEGLSGEEPISAVARVIRDILRTSDTLVRYSTREVVVLLPQTDGPTADQVARRVASRLTLPWNARRTADIARLRVVIGAASTPVHGESITALVKSAQNSAKSPEDLLPQSQSVH